MYSIARSFVAGSFLFVAFAAGCGQGAQDALDASGPSASDLLKAESGPGVWVRPGQFQVRCIAAPCPDREVQVINSTSTTLVYKFDWRQLALSAQDQAAVTTHLGDMLLFGYMVHQNVQGKDLPVLRVTKAYNAVSSQVSDDPQSDRFYSVTANQGGCTDDACATLSAHALGVFSSTPEQWASADLSQLQEPSLIETLLGKDLSTGNDIVSVQGVQDGVAQVSQVFRPLHASPIE